MLLDRFRLVDVARKVVGIGSVGTWRALILLIDDAGNPLLLQLKEARASALEPFVEVQPFANHGQRVVAGQRMMQATSDALLGWAVDGRCVYVRQFRRRRAHGLRRALRLGARPRARARRDDAAFVAAAPHFKGVPQRV